MALTPLDPAAFRTALDGELDAKVLADTLTTDGDVLTRAGGVPARITRADLAADSSFTDAFQPTANDRVWVPASQMTIADGTPTLSHRNRHPVWFLAINEILGANVALPLWWTTFAVDLYWSIANAETSVNVHWLVRDDQEIVDGYTLANPTVGDKVVAAPAQNVVAVSQISTGDSVPSAGVLGLNLIAGGGLTTLVGDALVLGLMYRRAS